MNLFVHENGKLSEYRGTQRQEMIARRCDYLKKNNEKEEMRKHAAEEMSKVTKVQDDRFSLTTEENNNILQNLTSCLPDQSFIHSMMQISKVLSKQQGN